ncbi:ABC transporter ATP-binding protein [Zavarzinia compransoris]|uniref:Branched-chain amino acid ABC transporter ATP-binding protein n=1 Tax=Zavarzinia compransoris TaxID=1264899 RepID=A0A317E8M6_9PROT|nr:ABC transporter ATP-binding protein [Zavarzinia compransoris]PWR21633.1 branched-chain amino acid ABC transporter ATP-binding protein [Zavarzinia compransoris]TDP45587.1 branched-chain amino acid transport system ATP-binding protein [Zavarzinia compransoris]
MLRVSEFLGGYHRGARVVDGISFDLGETPVTSIVGSNGAGKTSLLRGICGLLPWSAGAVQFAGEAIGHLPPHEIARRGIRMVPDGRGTFPTLSVLENLRVGGHGLKAAIVADRVERELARFPRLRERLHQAAGMLSGGEQQMLAIARAMVADPRLLILDEPSQGLAPLIVDQIFELLPLLTAQGVHILLIEQDVGRGLEASDRGIILEKGRITLEGDSRLLLADERVRESFLGIA